MSTDSTDGAPPESQPAGDAPPPRARPAMDPAALRFVEAGLRQGLPPAQIAKLCASQHHMSERTAFRYVAAVRRKLQGESDERTPEVMEAMILRAAAQASAAGNHAAAINALDKIAKRKRPSRRSVRVVREYEKVGAPPTDDPLAGVEWMQKLMLIAAHDVATDRTIAPDQRREELRRTARCVAALVPQDRIYDAEQRIRRDAGTMESTDVDPEVENVDREGNGAPKSLRVKAPRGRSR